jgi:hypothetical protein
MKRFLAILAAASLAAALSAGSVFAAKPVPAFTSTLVANADCTMTVTATWPRTADVDTVYGAWYQDDVFIFTTTAPFQNGTWTFNAKRRIATMTVGPLTSGASHNWRVLTQFYGGGAQLASIDSNTIATTCGV